jgi:septal ring factor EnvC (AmiA/AmiB activator)
MPENNSPNNKRNTRSVTNNQLSFSLSDIENLICKAKKEILSDFHDEVKKINISIEHLTTKIETFENRLSEIQTKSIENEKQINELRHNVLSMQNNLLDDVTNEMEQRAQRMQNLVISGISEKSSGSVQERVAHDEAEVKHVFNEMGLKKVNSYHVSRIGKPRQDRPRLLKVICPDVATKQTILRSGKSLRKSALYRNVFINEDRTPMQQESSRQLRADLRRRKELGEDVVIYRNRIVFRNEPQNFQKKF